jgi:hypothetical protein
MAVEPMELHIENRRKKVDWMETFDPDKPKVTLDDIRERVHQRYTLFLPQIELLMKSYDELSAMYDRLRNPALLREIHTRRAALGELRKAYKKAITPKEEKAAIKDLEQVGRVFDEKKKLPPFAARSPTPPEEPHP